ncbi:hypothetical protein JW899_04815 [Candidatus Uhrbacteria bacterium]|nr:hypothetical protein [Candidatus Uhrbacteria bacterium]
MPTIVTHISPHIDDICAVWLLKRYLPAWRKATVEFVSYDRFEEPVVDTPERFHVGVGRGRFDEHKGDVGECATSLVYAYINDSVVLNVNERKALDKLVEWVRMEDTGRFLADQYRPFSVPSILEGQFLAKGRDSEAVYGLGTAILDTLLIVMRNQVDLEADWERRVEFDSAVGRAVAMTSDVRRVENYAYRMGFPVFVRQTRDGRYTEIRAAADSDIDLSGLRRVIASADPAAGWFFHHSGKMMICGGETVSEPRPTSLNLDRIVELMGGPAA